MHYFFCFGYPTNKEMITIKDLLTFRIFLLILLFVGIVALGVGLSLFSDNISKASTALLSVRNQNFNVDFSNKSVVFPDEEVSSGDIIPERNVQGFSANPAIIDNTGDPKLKNIQIVFHEPGESVSYTFYAANIGNTTAFLKGIIFENIVDTNHYIKCTPISVTTKELVEKACKDIKVSLEVGNSGIQNGSIGNIYDHILLKNTTEKINIIIDYKINGTPTDGEFIVDIGDISLLYSPID
jgi:hypothetical protein